jgi:hypothetical protein
MAGEKAFASIRRPSSLVCKPFFAVYQVRSGEDEMEAWCLKQTDTLTAKKGLQTNDDVFQ